MDTETQLLIPPRCVFKIGMYLRLLTDLATQKVASHAGVFRGARTPVQPETFLSHCFICVVSDQ